MIKGKAIKSYPTVSLTASMKDRASIRAEEIPSDIANSILEGEGRLTGTLGEVAFEKFTGGVKNPASKPWHFDVLFNGKLYEVKTKLRAVLPQPWYDCSVCAANDKQECDYYVFASVKGSTVWLLGYISREEFKRVRVFRKKGEYDPTNKQTCKWDCWNVKVSQLRDIKELLNE